MSDKEETPPVESSGIHFKLSGNIIGSQLTLDPVTGYLESPQKYKGLTAAKKVLCVQNARELWPNLTAIARTVGINRVTLTNHMMFDAKFKTDMENAKAEKLDTLEQVMADHALDPHRGFMDRIALLRAYRGERFNPDSKVTITHESNTSPQDRAKKISEVIDTDLIQDQKLELDGRSGDGMDGARKPQPKPSPIHQTPKPCSKDKKGL